MSKAERKKSIGKGARGDKENRQNGKKKPHKTARDPRSILKIAMVIPRSIPELGWTAHLGSRMPKFNTFLSRRRYKSTSPLRVPYS